MILLAGRQEGDTACKKLEGWWRWALVSRMEWRPAGWSVCLPLLILPCTIKSRSSLLAPAHPGGPGKRAIEQLWCGGGGDRLPWYVNAFQYMLNTSHYTGWDQLFTTKLNCPLWIHQWMSLQCKAKVLVYSTHQSSHTTVILIYIPDCMLGPDSEISWSKLIIIPTSPQSTAAVIEFLAL